MGVMKSRELLEELIGLQYSKILKEMQEIYHSAQIPAFAAIALR